MKIEMDANQYQILASRMLVDEPPTPVTPQEIMILWNAIGAAGEAGELANMIKKGILHRHGVDPEKIRDEIGDVLWYLAGLCTQFGFTLGDAMESNIAKLKKRYPDGFSEQDSKLREEIHNNWTRFSSTQSNDY
jgi:NTP pyrophosphatase (non-canonical NTP hydrolase)